MLKSRKQCCMCGVTIGIADVNVHTSLVSPLESAQWKSFAPESVAAQDVDFTRLQPAVNMAADFSDNRLQADQSPKVTVPCLLS